MSAGELRSAVLARAWARIAGVEVLSSADGGPLTRTVKKLIDPLVIRTAARPRLGRPVLNPAAAAEVTELLLADAPRLRATAAWFTHLKRQRRALRITAGNVQDVCFPLAYELATGIGAPGPDAPETAAAALRDLHGEGGEPGVGELAGYLTDPRVAADLTAELHRRWHAQSPPADAGPPSLPSPPAAESGTDAAGGGGAALVAGRGAGAAGSGGDAGLADGAAGAALVAGNGTGGAELGEGAGLVDGGAALVAGRNTGAAGSGEGAGLVDGGAARGGGVALVAGRGTGGAGSGEGAGLADGAARGGGAALVAGNGTAAAGSGSGALSAGGLAAGAGPVAGFGEWGSAGPVLAECVTLLGAFAAGLTDSSWRALARSAAGHSLGLALRRPGGTASLAWAVQAISGLPVPGLGLQRGDRTCVPPLSRRDETGPELLERSVERRVRATLRRLPPDERTSVADLVDDELGRVAAGFGLTRPGLAGCFALGVVLAPALRPLDGAAPAGVPEFARQLNAQVAREGYVLHARRALAGATPLTPRPDAGLLRDLHGFARQFLGRLWIRLHGFDVRGEVPADAADVRDLVTGVVRSTSLDLRTKVRRALVARPPDLEAVS